MRRTIVSLTLLALVTGFLAILVPPASAQLPGSTFESSDGNLVVDTTGNHDWVNAPNRVVQLDKPSGSADDSFGQGAKEDVPNPSVVSGSIPPNKSDLSRFYVSHESAGGNFFLYLAWERTNVLGSANMDFEFNQSKTIDTNGVTPVRTAGDMLITYDFVNGGSRPVLGLLRWVTTGATGQCFSSNSLPCWGNRVDLSAAGFADGMVNTGSVTDPVPPAAPRTLAGLTFGEAAINLTAANIFPPNQCINFASAFLKSRSSASFTAELKDFIAPSNASISNCLTKTFSLAFDSGSPPIANTTVYAVYTTPDNVVHNLPLTLSGSTYTGSDPAIKPGSTLSNVRLEIRNAAGTSVLWHSGTILSETINSDTLNSGTFNYKLILSPHVAENFVNHPHVFTATVTGSGTFSTAPPVTDQPIVGVPVNFRLEPTPSCATLSPSSAATDANGQATTTVNSTTACSTTVRAWVNSVGGTAGFETTEVNDSGTKSFAVYALSVTPVNATNALGTNHTFTIKLTRDVGSGPVGVSGHLVTFSLVESDPARPTGAYIVSINGTATGNTTTKSGTCTTKADGTCEVVVTAPNAGTFRLDASTDVTNDSGTGTFTSSGTKSFVAYRVTVTPGSATNEVNVEHTFTALLERNTGSGFAPYTGQTLSLALTPTNIAYITSINGTPTGNITTTSGSCVTRVDDPTTPTVNEAGTCVVKINSSKPGTVTLTATFATQLDSGDFSTSGMATKTYEAFTLTITPASATNLVGVEHEFTVKLTIDDGSGVKGYQGQIINLTLNPGATDAHFTFINGVASSGTTATCTTRADGTCSVKIVATTPGTVTLRADWSQKLSDESTVTKTATATKIYLNIQVSKTSCVDTVPPNGLVTFDIPWSAGGASLTNAKIVDNLPASLLYDSSTPTANTHPAVGSSGQVVWNLISPLPSGSSGTVHLSVLVAPNTAPGTVITNSGVFTADDPSGGATPISVPFSKTINVGTGGAAASGRAYGATVKLLGATVIPPTPDVTNGATQLFALPANPTINVSLLAVSNVPSVTATKAEDNASATAANVDVELPGVSVKATAVAARSDSLATGSTATTNTNGSEVLGLSINGTTIGDISTPRVIAVVNLAGAQIAEVDVLENTDASGAALGGAAGAQPIAGLFSSGLTVNGLHIKLLDGTADVIVSHAQSLAVFPTLTPCVGTGPFVIGNAVIANEVLTYPTGPTIATINGITLPSTGGDVTSTANTLTLSPLGATSGTGSDETKGALSPLNATSNATVQSLTIPGLTAVAVSSTATANPAANPALSGSSTIVKLVIGSTDVCAALGLQRTCTPAPNTVLIDLTHTLKIVLNEQTVSNGKAITVNAVHIFVLGTGNPLGLPVGSDLIISGSTAGTS